MTLKKTVLLMFGGKSPEHKISIISARTIYKVLEGGEYNVLLAGVTKETGKIKILSPNDLENLDMINEDLSRRTGFVAKIKDSPVIYYVTDDQVSLDNNLSPDNDLLFSDRHVPYRENIYSTTKHDKFDIVFPCFHGTCGEDGVIQGWLEFLNIPYVGSNLQASATAIDKDLTKHTIKDLIIFPSYLTLYIDSDILGFEQSLAELNALNSKSATRYLIVKSCTQGSSISVTKVSNEEDFQHAIKYAFTFGNKVLVEQYIDSNELDIAVIGSTSAPVVSKNAAEVEIKPQFPFYTYEAKYISNGAILHIPARLSLQQIDYIREIARKIYIRIGCKGLARVDFLLCKKSGQIYFNEINTMPGIRQTSAFVRLFQEDGVDLKQLIDLILSSV